MASSIHKHTVVKTIRVNPIHKLSYLVDSIRPVDYSIKIAHLVRDPRAVLNTKVLDSSNEIWTVGRG